MNQGFVEMFRYNAWANRQFFEACRSLTDEQLDTHATEVKVALAQIGLKTPDLDGWNYAGAAGYGQEVL